MASYTQKLKKILIPAFDSNGNRGRQIAKNADVYTYENYGIDIALQLSWR